MYRKVKKKLQNISQGGLYVFTVVLGMIGIASYNLVMWILDTWKDLKIDEIIFHLKVPVEGTNSDLIMDGINTCVPSIIVVMFTICIILIGIKKNWIRNLTAMIVLIVSIGAINYSATYIWKELGVDDYIKNRQEESTFIEDNYVDPRNTQITFPEKKRNLVYIFIESMESSFASESEGGLFQENYIPELTQLDAANVNFSDTDLLGGAYTTTGTTWTIGGIFGQTSGLPLTIPIDGNAMGEQNEFFPDIITLGDILKEQGYNQWYMIGSDAAFGGRDKYFEQHGNYNIFDYYTAIEEGKIGSDYLIWWGYEDQKLFDYAKEKLSEISMQEEPFNFTLLTADTHFPSGLICPLCGEEYPNQFKNVYACASRQIAEFISWIQQQPFYENTTVVLCGDHLTMDATYFEDISKEDKRRVYNMYINASANPVREKNREFTTLDFFPTTLASMGVQIAGDRLGLGTNLFSETQTLTEQYGFEAEDKELQRDSKFFDHFIDYIQ